MLKIALFLQKLGNSKNLMK